MKSTKNFMLFLALLIGQICYNSDLHAAANKVVTADGLIQESLCTPEMIESVVSANKNIQILSIDKQTGEITNLPSIPTMINSLPVNEATKPAFHTLLEATEIALFTQELSSKYDGLNFNPEFNIKARLEQQKTNIQNKINIISKQQSFYNWAFGSSTANNLSHSYTNINIDPQAAMIAIPVGFLPAIAQHNNYKTYHKTKHASEAANLLFQQTFIAQQHRFPNPIALKIHGNHITSEHYIYHGFPNFHHLCNSILDLDQSQRRSRLLQIRQALQTALFVANRKSAANIGYLIPQSAVSYLDGVVAELLRYDNHMNTLCMDSRYGATPADIAKAPEWSTFSKVAAGVVAAAVVIGVGTYAYDQFNGTNNLGDTYKATTDWLGGAPKSKTTTDLTNQASDALVNLGANGNTNPNMNANANQDQSPNKNPNTDANAGENRNTTTNPNMNANQDQSTNANTNVHQNANPNANAQASANLHQNQNVHPKPLAEETKLATDVHTLIETLDSNTDTTQALPDKKEDNKKTATDGQIALQAEVKRLADKAEAESIEVERKQKELEESNKKAAELAAQQLVQEKAERKRIEDEDARLKAATDTANAELAAAEKVMAQQEEQRRKIQKKIDERAQQLDLQEIKRDDMEIAIRDSFEFKTGWVPESQTYRGIANADEEVRKKAEREKDLALDAESTAKSNLAEAQTTLRLKKANELIAQGPLNKAESELAKAQRQYDIDNPPSMFRFGSAVSSRPTITNEIQLFRESVKKAAAEIITQEDIVTALTTVASEKIETATKAITKADIATRKANNSRKWADTADEVKDKIIRQNGAIRDRTREESTNLENNRFNQIEIDRQNRLKALGVSDISTFTASNSQPSGQLTTNNNQPPTAPSTPAAPSQQVAAPAVEAKTEQPAAKLSYAQAVLRRANKALGIDEREELLERDELQANSQALAASGPQVAAPANLQTPAAPAAPGQQVATPAVEPKKSGWFSFGSSSKEETKVAPENAAPAAPANSQAPAAEAKSEDTKKTVNDKNNNDTPVVQQKQTKKQETIALEGETPSLLEITLNKINQNITKSGEEYREEQRNHQKEVDKIKKSREFNGYTIVWPYTTFEQEEKSTEITRQDAQTKKDTAEQAENEAEKTLLKEKEKLNQQKKEENGINGRIIKLITDFEIERLKHPTYWYTENANILTSNIKKLKAERDANSKPIRNTAEAAYTVFEQKRKEANTARRNYNTAAKAADQAKYDANLFRKLKKEQFDSGINLIKQHGQSELAKNNKEARALTYEEVGLKGQLAWAEAKDAVKNLNWGKVFNQNPNSYTDEYSLNNQQPEESINLDNKATLQSNKKETAAQMHARIKKEQVNQPAPTQSTEPATVASTAKYLRSFIPAYQPIKESDEYDPEWSIKQDRSSREDEMDRAERAGRSAQAAQPAREAAEERRSEAITEKNAARDQLDLDDQLRRNLNDSEAITEKNAARDQLDLDDQLRRNLNDDEKIALDAANLLRTGSINGR